MSFMKLPNVLTAPLEWWRSYRRPTPVLPYPVHSTMASNLTEWQATSERYQNNSSEPDDWFSRQLARLCERAIYYPRTDESEARFRDEVMSLLKTWYKQGNTITDHEGNSIRVFEEICLMIQRDPYAISIKAFRKPCTFTL